MARPGQRGDLQPDAPLPTTWSATEHLAWRAPLAGAGTSSPIVVGDRVIVTSQIGRAPVARRRRRSRSWRATIARSPGAKRAIGEAPAAAADAGAI